MNLPFQSISEWKVTLGKRAFLLCGVSYNKQKFKLTSTINNTKSMKKLLIADQFKVHSSSIHILAVFVEAFTDEMAGAMTYTFKRAVEKNPKITYFELLTSMLKAIKVANNARSFNKLREIFRSKSLREPMLSSSQVFNPNMELKL
ncbi:hypothetical protein LguiA_027192 [Lonicera macranthoides]